MIISQKLEISLCLLLMFVLVGPGVCQNECRPRCGNNDNVSIKFPFRLKDSPRHCGYPGFELSCPDTNQTALELPFPVKFFIKSIDYKHQTLQVYDPEKCLPRQILNFLNLSSSAFHFQEILYNNYTFFSCTPSIEREVHSSLISCLSDSTKQILAVHDYNIVGDPSFVGCTKISDVFSAPWEIESNSVDDTVLLSWSKPDCGRCEAKRQSCGLENGTLGGETKCSLFKPNHHRGTSYYKRKLEIPGLVVGSLLVVLVMGALLYHTYLTDKAEKVNRARINMFLQEYKTLKPARYSYADIKRITNQFKDKLGQGAYGTVYKGRLSDEVQVAAKILNNSKGNGEEFINEVEIIGRIHHVNVVRLVGFCADGFRRALVYEFLENGSLKNYISPQDNQVQPHSLGLEKLHEIAIGIAKGIEYLHQGCDQRILHFDIKPHNILLDQYFTPKISDFGLAKLCSKEQSIVSMTTVKGTMGYIAPEVFSRNFGSVSYKADVYSFGMLLLEMVGEKKNISAMEEDGGYVGNESLSLEKRGLQNHVGEEDVDEAKIAKKLRTVGLWCIQWHPANRPSIKVVLQMLEGEDDNLTSPPIPFTSTGPTTTNGRRQNLELEIIPEIE